LPQRSPRTEYWTRYEAVEWNHYTEDSWVATGACGYQPSPGSKAALNIGDLMRELHELGRLKGFKRRSPGCQGTGAKTDAM